MILDIVLIVGMLTAIALAGWWWTRRNGRLVTTEESLAPGTRDVIGAPDEQAAILLFTTPTCGNCEAARGVLRTVTQRDPSVSVVEVDVASHPDVARDHRVLRAPTVLVVDHRDGIRARVSGVPDLEELRQALPA